VGTTRITLAQLMVVVGVIALESAGFRAFYRGDELTLGLALPVLACQFGLFGAVRGRGRVRAFCGGFVAFGLVMIVVFAWGMCFPKSRIYDLWASYIETAEGVLSTIPNAPGWLFQDAGMAVVLSFPQLLAALIGGVLATLAMWRHVGRPGDRHLDPAEPFASP
jgi:hypothetical protein